MIATKKAKLIQNKQQNEKYKIFCTSQYTELPQKTEINIQHRGTMVIPLTIEFFICSVEFNVPHYTENVNVALFP